MQPLLRIQSIPINIEYKVQRAALQYQYQSQSRPATVEVSRARGSLNMQSVPAQLKIDSYEARASAGQKSAARLSQEFADNGKNAGYEATRQIADDGNYYMDSKGDKGAIANLVTNKTVRGPETMMTFMPSVRPQISAVPGNLTFNPTMDKLTFDWNINHKPQLEYVPGSIEFSVSQYPDVVIEYIGSPIYVPPSADPDYVPPPGIDASV